MPFTLRNIKKDLEDIGPRFDGAPDLEFRAATKALELEKGALSYQRVPPGYRFPYGHTHETQEEVYVVLHGSGRMKVDDEIVELEEWDAVRVPPGTWRGYEAGAEGRKRGQGASRSSSSARQISARIRAKTSTAGAFGGATSRRRTSEEPGTAPAMSRGPSRPAVATPLTPRCARPTRRTQSTSKRPRL